MATPTIPYFFVYPDRKLFIFRANALVTQLSLPYIIPLNIFTLKDEKGLAILV